MRNLSVLIITTVVVIVAVSFGLSKWQAVGMAIASTAIPIFWQMFRPLPIEFTFRSGEFNLMFRDFSYASEVAALNEGELDDGNIEIESEES